MPEALHWASSSSSTSSQLILIEIFPDSFVLVSMYGLLGNAVRVTLGSSVGAHIDRAERWEGARDCYVIQVS